MNLDKNDRKKYVAKVLQLRVHSDSELAFSLLKLLDQIDPEPCFKLKIN